LLKPSLCLLLAGSLMSGPQAALGQTSKDCQTALAAAALQQSDLLQRAPELAVLMLGEIHTSSADHEWQLRTLERLSLQRQLVLGLEMIPAARQPVLNRFNSGTIDLAALLKEVDWPSVWGHDPELYVPLLRWARLKRVPLLALNAEPALVRQVRQSGLAALSPAQLKGIDPPAPASQAYRQRLTISWRVHQPPGDSHNNAADLERFIDSQVLRDRVMAKRLVAAHRLNPQPLLVALIGVGHMEENDGVPQQLRQLGLKQQLALKRPLLPDGCVPPPSGARLGAFLESDPSGVWVRQVAPGSAAAAAGLRPGDRILELNGQSVQRAGQVIRGVRLHPDGVQLRLTIERKGQRIQLDLQLPASNEPAIAARDNGANA
jgi:uncharacterized iron-regulated protein